MFCTKIRRGVKRLKNKLYILLFLLPALMASPAYGFAQSVPRELEPGVNHFADGRFNDSLYFFRSVISDPKLSDLHGDAYFWLSKTHLALNNVQDAEKNLEYFLMNYVESPNYAEGLYQKGRLLFLQNEYESAIQVLYNFIDQFPDNSFVGNSFFWIGESLYAMGHLDKATKVYQKIVRDYPKSYKIDAAKYRISLIELKYREQELMKFLKWSHEESLKTLEEFQIREKTYEQAIAAYQKKLSEYAEAGTERKIEDLTLDLREKEAEVIELKDRVDTLNDTIAELQGTVAKLEENLAQARRETAVEAEVEVTGSETAAVIDQDADDLRQLLAVKEKALELKEFYLDWLRENREN